jgi:hypothetical protein
LAEAGPRTTVSLRFAVCHPTSIDDVFTTLVVDLANAPKADIVIAEDVEPDDPGLGWSFSPSRLPDVRKSLLQCIPKKRGTWTDSSSAAPLRGQEEKPDERAYLLEHGVLTKFGPP